MSITVSNFSQHTFAIDTQ
ncbi:Bgt-50295 [Blumeria graminis f. sp. tritici]|uniref:Bgt-50295 n=1 Tax=Blumeria graminis f. sp. tritici TaxID=62690 RepID=A0A9X9MNH8_BLUGR|nr:Bgt-50295 [Blumeria graminis f. sp. tritici]